MTEVVDLLQSKGKAVKVLAVDDHPLIREALRYVLTALDPCIELLEAQNVSEARAVAGQHPDIALILLDLGLPGSSGFDILRELREQRPEIPVVVLSASDHPQNVIRALDEGAMGFIPKASKNDVLVNALRLVLSGGVYLPAQVLRHEAPTLEPVPPAGTQVTYRDIGLTERQAQVLASLVQGKPNKLICRELNLAEGTVKIHVTAILKALKVTKSYAGRHRGEQVGTEAGSHPAQSRDRERQIAGLRTFGT